MRASPVAAEPARLPAIFKPPLQMGAGIVAKVVAVFQIQSLEQEPYLDPFIFQLFGDGGHQYNHTLRMRQQSLGI